jgi:CRP-like cAMP-binding protein
MPEQRYTPSGTALIQEAAWIAQHMGSGAASPLSRPDISALAASLCTRQLRRGGTAFESYAPSTGAWIVRSGRLELETDSGGPHQRVLRVLRPGDVDGDIQLLLRTPMPYTARAVEDSVCLYLAPDRFERLLRRHPALTRRWMASVAERLERSQGRVIGMLGRSLPQQAARLLLDEATGGVLDIPQASLAGMLGVRRSSLNKVLKEFEHQGLVRVRYGSIEVLDLDGLAKHSE